jgi:hypothetical protein
MKYVLDVELSERELILIGKVVALWGSLEYEIFCQTLISLNPSDSDALPKQMNNVQFSQVLDIWETLFVQNAKGRRKATLQTQCKAIRHYVDFRNAIVHGMWDWSGSAPEKISATRIRKREIIRTHFTADDLASFVSELQVMNFKVRYPGGRREYVKAMAKKGSSMTRLGLCLMTSNPLTNELLPSSMRLPDNEDRQPIAKR